MKVQGGLLEIITRAVEIECLPDEIPESFTIDVTELMIGQNKRASDVPLSGSMKLHQRRRNRDRARSGSPRREVVAAPEPPLAAPAAAAEPEVIKKGKKEEEAARRGKGQEEVSRHVPGGRSGEPGRGVRAHAA